jgi:acyl-CoA dehydrogenase
MITTDTLRVRAAEPEERRDFRESVHRLLQAESGPAPDTGHLLALAGRHGFLGPRIAEEFGGGGVDDPWFTAILIEEAMGLGLTALALSVALGIGVAAPLIADFGTADQRSQWLPGLADGSLRVAVAGDRCGVVGGGDASLLLYGDADGHADTVIAMPVAAVAFMPSSDPLQIAGLPSVDLVLDGLPPGPLLPAAPMLGDHDLWLAVLALGGARAALAWTEAYTRERQVFGRPVASFENTGVVLAELTAAILTTQSFVDCCLDARGHGRLDRQRSAAAVITAVGVHAAAVDHGLQFHGGYGYMREYPISTAFADAAVIRRLALPGVSRHEVLRAGR